eukprot:m.249971 g.249971  ORF g.249971 m.249971 type:complete len:132 (+) comp19529_c1_seq15:2068-2463(+)
MHSKSRHTTRRRHVAFSHKDKVVISSDGYDATCVRRFPVYVKTPHTIHASVLLHVVLVTTRDSRLVNDTPGCDNNAQDVTMIHRDVIMIHSGCESISHCLHSLVGCCNATAHLTTALHSNHHGAFEGTFLQ